MFSHSISRIILIIVLLAGVIGTALQAAPTARAQAAPSITATIDAKTYGVILVAGQNLTPRTTATVEVRDAASGAMLISTTVRVDGCGRFVKTLAISVTSGTPLVTRVMVRAIDASQAVTDDLTVALSTPVALIQQQMAGVQQGLDGARAAVQQRLAAVMQASQQLVAAQQQLAAAQMALRAAVQTGATADVIRQLQLAVDVAQTQLLAAQQAFAAAQEAFTAAVTLVDQLQVAAGELQQELNQAQTPAVAS